MLALVTGGHGFIGSHLCRHLCGLGHRVRVLARPGSDRGLLAGLDLETVPGDLAGAAGLARAVAGVDWVFHLAGALKGFREADLMAVNRDGTRRLTEACRAHAPGLWRFLLVASLAAAGPSTQPLAADAPARPLTWYGQSKLAAEQVVLESGLPALILRPPVVFGPGDRELLAYFRIARSGWLPVPGDGQRRYSLIYAPDLAGGLVQAALAPCPAGEIFNLTGPDLAWAELGLRIAAALGRPGRLLPVPDWAVRLGARAADLGARARGRAGIFSSQKALEMLAESWVASPDKARRLLGWVAPTALDSALASTVAWYRDHGWI